MGGSTVRPDVLAYPSPTTSRYLIFAVALLSSGLFVGNWVHNRVLGDQWQESVLACERASPGAGAAALLEEQERYAACTADVERVRSGFMVGGAAAIALAAAGVMFVAPVVVRRRRRLKALDPRLEGASRRFDELAAAAGVGRRARPLLGPAAQRDAFTFGSPGRYFVVLPPGLAVRWRSRSLFDPVVSHELAHVAHRDVALAWLIRSVWWVLAPLLLLPVVVALVSGDRSVLVDYLWRAGLLAVSVVLLSSALLRSREHAADLRAARLAGGPEVVAGLVGATAQRVRRLGRLLAKHPPGPARAAVVERPLLFTRTGFVDGLVGAFLATVAVPLLVSGLVPALAPSGRTLDAYTAAAVLVGPMLGGSVGLGIWRAVVVARATGAAVPVAGVALGVWLGWMLGQAVSLDNTGLGSVTGLRNPVWLVVCGLAGSGAVVLSWGLAHLWADDSPRLPSVGVGWLVALVVNSVLFSATLWATAVFQTATDLGGWALARLVVGATMAPTPFALAVLAVVAFAVVPLLLPPPRQADVPGWLVEGDGRAPWPVEPPARVRLVVLAAFLAGVAGTAVLVLFRLDAGAAASDEENLARLSAYGWVAAATAAGVAVALTLWRPPRGPGIALAALPVTLATELAGFLVLNSALGGRPDPALAVAFARPALVLAFYLVLLTLPAALLAAAVLRSALGPATDAVRRRGALGADQGPAAVTRRTGPAILLVAGTVVAAALAGWAAIDGRGTLVAAGSPADQAATDPAGRAVALAVYEIEVVDAVAGYGELIEVALRIDSDPALDAATKAALLQEQVVRPVGDLLQRVRSYQPPSEELAAVHQHAVRALETAEAKYSAYAAGYRLRSEELFAQGRLLQGREDESWRAWFESREALRDELGTP